MGVKLIEIVLPRWYFVVTARIEIYLTISANHKLNENPLNFIEWHFRTAKTTK